MVMRPSIGSPGGLQTSIPCPASIPCQDGCAALRPTFVAYLQQRPHFPPSARATVTFAEEGKEQMQRFRVSVNPLTGRVIVETENVPQ